MFFIRKRSRFGRQASKIEEVTHLGMFEMRLEHVADVLSVTEIQSCIYLIQVVEQSKLHRSIVTSCHLCLRFLL